MNYYGLWVKFKDGHNEFYNPAEKALVRPKILGTKMPNEYFFTRDDLSLHQRIVKKLFCGACYQDVEFHFSEIRPQDPDFADIDAYFNQRSPA